MATMIVILEGQTSEVLEQQIVEYLTSWLGRPVFDVRATLKKIQVPIFYDPGQQPNPNVRVVFYENDLGHDNQDEFIGAYGRFVLTVPWYLQGIIRLKLGH